MRGNRLLPDILSIINCWVREMRGNGCRNPSWLLSIKLRTGRCLATVVPMVNMIYNFIQEMRGNGCCNPSWLLSVKFGTGKCLTTVAQVIDIYIYTYTYAINQLLRIRDMLGNGRVN